MDDHVHSTQPCYCTPVFLYSLPCKSLSSFELSFVMIARFFICITLKNVINFIEFLIASCNSQFLIESSAEKTDLGSLFCSMPYLKLLRSLQPTETTD